MSVIKRNHCVLTGKNDLEPLYSFPHFPVFMGTTTQPPEQDVFADMNWHISKETGIIQLNPLLPLEILYPESHNAGSVGGLWAKHHEALADFVHKHGGANILEIGGGHGILATKYAQKYGETNWTIVEPNPTPVDNCQATYIRGFFNSAFSMDGYVDTVVHSHVFEHVYDPASFIKDISKFMSDGDMLIFSVPNMAEMLKNKYTNCINFEHTLYLNENYIHYLLQMGNFELKEEKYFLNNHSIFFAAEKKSLPTECNFQNEYALNKERYRSYIEYHKSMVEDINHFIFKHQDIFLFGAHIFAQYLIAFGLDLTKVKFILDNDATKHNKRFYGTGLQVVSPRVLLDYHAPVVILHAGVFDEEIRNDIIKNINAKTLFI